MLLYVGNPKTYLYQGIRVSSSAVRSVLCLVYFVFVFVAFGEEFPIVVADEVTV